MSVIQIGPRTIRLGTEEHPAEFMTHKIDGWVIGKDNTVIERGTWDVELWSMQQQAVYDYELWAYRQLAAWRLLRPLARRLGWVRLIRATNKPSKIRNVSLSNIRAGVIDR